MKLWLVFFRSEDWKTLARAYLKLKAERDSLAREVERLRARDERSEAELAAYRSRIAALAEDNGEGAW